MAVKLFDYTKFLTEYIIFLKFWRTFSAASLFHFQQGVMFCVTTDPLD